MDCCAIWHTCGPPREIRDVAVLKCVLEHMRSAERGLRRLHAALDKLGAEALTPVLKANQLISMERIDNLETLKRVVLELERGAETS